MLIPAGLSDNPKLLSLDPNYVARLQRAGSAMLVRAWLEGDWNITEGAFFDNWSNRNVICPFAIPQSWPRFRSFDWGYASPSSVGWWAVVTDDYAHEAGVLPRGALVRYREWYGAHATSAAGLRLDVEAVGDGIVEREAGGLLRDGVADPALLARRGGPSLAPRV